MSGFLRPVLHILPTACINVRIAKLFTESVLYGSPFFPEKVCPPLKHIKASLITAIPSLRETSPPVSYTHLRAHET